ncbi:hypothetical protein BgAZ_107580 [Babesia gibsoni]|uniref:Uncharacterized protein n=1 Tax=Babesia gibsoni TaxID=33632 RepID=A0AAD8UUM7_BABGI|nr:hypothetical protein BgAZ_107580 [Babesia gibsoni]
MDRWNFVMMMTGGYAAVGVVLTLFVIICFRHRVDRRKTDNFEGLVALVVLSTAFCLWLLWICMYMAQMHPMISPIKHIHEHAEEAKPVAKVAVATA